MKRKTIIYLIVTFGWTWICWIGAYIISNRTGYSLVTDLTIFKMINQLSEGNVLFPQILFFLGVYGPMIGYITVNCHQKGLLKINKHLSFVGLAVIIPLVMVIPSFILSILFKYGSLSTISSNLAVSSIVLYFISNFFTSGTEELGWRGYLYPYLRQKESTFWNASWKGGIIWAIWHYPLLVILYMEQGVAILLPSLVGFTAGIIAVNYITNFIFEKTESISVVMGMHALNNTTSFAILLFFPQTPFLILTHLMAWVIVGYLEKKYRLS